MTVDLPEKEPIWPQGPQGPLRYEYNKTTDVLEIEGNRFAGNFFRFFRDAKPGVEFSIIEKKDGVITIRVLKEAPK